MAALFFMPGARTPERTTAPEPHQQAGRLPVFEIYPKEHAVPAPHPCVTKEKKPGRPRVAIIIDDMGYDEKIANRLISLGVPLTFSILPYSPRAADIAEAAHRNNIEVMLHLPMEPVEYPDVNPGKGALLTSMSPDELIGQLEKDIRQVPYVDGVNNHMGSRMTAISTRLYQIFSVLKKHGLFFIDSRTTPDTLCRPSARLFQIPFAERDLFIDNVPNVQSVERQIDRLIEIAKKNGKAIGIGHAHKTTCIALAKKLPEIKDHIDLVHASSLVCIVDR
ncbi:MAG: hypothetical protein B5M56_09800 [Desulfococcus sp. 4484_241]|nr:MAG: hypothetical protein B5M56_09800 [Desulfococcus sp. 4484_241]